MCRFHGLVVQGCESDYDGKFRSFLPNELPKCIHMKRFSHCRAEGCPRKVFCRMSLAAAPATEFIIPWCTRDSRFGVERFALLMNILFSFRRTDNVKTPDRYTQ